jgi:precorrin-2 dehydrogenase/sirohydrochlorin ferrochelatase
MMLDVSQRLVVIVGGGAVAARKARGLLDGGASRVRMISPDFCDTVPPEVERITGGYELRHLEGAGLVFAATDDTAVNDAVVNDAHGLNLLVNRADATETSEGDFATPATLRHEDLVITVSTGGAPALAAAIRDDLRAKLDPRLTAMVRAVKDLRPRALEILDIERRRQILRGMTTPQALQVLDRQGVQGLWNWLCQCHPANHPEEKQ